MSWGSRHETIQNMRSVFMIDTNIVYSINLRLGLTPIASIDRGKKA